MTRIISTEELLELKHSGRAFVFLNVLSHKQHDQEHISGSSSAPMDSPNFMKYVEAQTGGDTELSIVVYCAGEACDASSRAARALEVAGYNDVQEYSGGMAAWKESHPQEVSQARPTQEEMASISAAVRAGEAGRSFGQLDLDDEQELELAGSERDAERENWTRVCRPSTSRPHPSERTRGRSTERVTNPWQDESLAATLRRRGFRTLDIEKTKRRAGERRKTGS